MTPRRVVLRAQGTEGRDSVRGLGQFFQVFENSQSQAGGEKAGWRESVGPERNGRTAAAARSRRPTPPARGEGRGGEGERYINLRHTHTHTPWERSTRERIFSDFDFGPSFSLGARAHTHACVCALSAHTPLFCMQFHIIIYYAYIEYVVCFFHNIMHTSS